MEHKDVLTAHIARYILGGVFGLVLGLASMWGYAYYNDWQTRADDACTKQYSLTNQSLDCALYDARANQLQALDAKLEAATDQYIKEGKATRVSVFVRGLRTRLIAASNENETFAPASLLKLPLMIAYYKIAEIEPTILDRQLTYASSSSLNDSSQDFVPANTFVFGQKYTVEQLIENMTINSDNNSASVLLSHIDENIFNNTLVDLGLKIPAGSSQVDFVTAKTYASIFSMLYNASYLNRDFSQKALTLMSKSAFKGIAAGLPSDSIVADKFGEREVDNPDGSVAKRELHDCGIVYDKDERPYSICIMTEGKNFKDLQAILKDLAKITDDSLQ